MKCITLQQPWATLIAIGAKRIETRSWRTSYRGPIAIHAAFGWPDWAREFSERSDVRMLAEEYIDTRVLTWNERLEVDRGHILATANLDMIVTTGMIRASRQKVLPQAALDDGDGAGWINEQERLLGDYSLGRWAWVLSNVEELELPVEVRGHLGLWTWHREAS